MLVIRAQVPNSSGWGPDSIFNYGLWAWASIQDTILPPTPILLEKRPQPSQEMINYLFSNTSWCSPKKFSTLLLNFLLCPILPSYFFHSLPSLHLSFVSLFPFPVLIFWQHFSIRNLWVEVDSCSFVLKCVLRCCEPISHPLYILRPPQLGNKPNPHCALHSAFPFVCANLFQVLTPQRSSVWSVITWEQ